MERQRGQEGSRVTEQWSKLFGANVRLRRVQMGFHTQQALAEHLGFATHGTITQIEMGNVVANFEVAMKLASFLHISLDTLLGLPQPEPMVPRGPVPGEWYSDMLMLRVPGLWPPHVRQRAMVSALKGIVEVLEARLLPGPPSAGMDEGQA